MIRETLNNAVDESNSDDSALGRANVERWNGQTSRSSEFEINPNKNSTLLIINII